MSQCAVFKGDSSNVTSKKNSGKTKDKLFDPSIDMMVNDFDDEQTLEEEEALAAGEAEDPNAELSSLQREGDMPLDELLAQYYGSQPPEFTDAEEVANADQMDADAAHSLNADPEPDPDPDAEPDVDPEEEEEESKQEAEPSKLQQLYDPIPEADQDGHDGSRLLRSVSRVHSDEEEDDYDYSPDEDEWKKTIMVGSDYQAVIPEGLCSYDDALPYENEDKLLWDPHPLDAKQTEDFLWRASLTGSAMNSGVMSLPTGRQLRDDEQNLYLLLQCGHNVEEALRRRRINSIPSSDAMSLWSEEECRNFENGLRSYGKDFHMIQQHKVRTRSVGELVQFYYLWKKTERHDVFANKARLEKKKYTLHPGLTDFMDRFLEEQEGARDRSSSPNIQCANTNTSTGEGKKSNPSNGSTMVSTITNATNSLSMTTPPSPFSQSSQLDQQSPNTKSIDLY